MKTLCKECKTNPVTNPNYRGLCSSCRTKKYAYSKGKKCANCGKPISNKSKVCDDCKHINRRNRVTRTCSECEKVYETTPSNKKLFCSKKCRQKVWVRNASRKGEYSNTWRGGGPSIQVNGYVDIYDENRMKRIHEHTKVVEDALGRRLKKGEVIHHINLIKSDNRNRNLLVCSPSYHRYLHSKRLVRFVKSHPSFFTEEQKAH